MRTRLSNLKAFTLTEVLVSMLLIAIISAAGWMSISILSPTALATQNRVKAENLLTKSQEEVHRVAQNQFDTLETCDFTSANTCGFSDISAQFPEFTRTLQVTLEGTTDFKRARITVSWVEFGQTKFLDSVILLARPPEPLPGNIIGMARDQNTNAVLGNVQLSLQDINAANSATATSSSTVLSRPDNKQVNYSFAEVGTGRFVLPPGTWRLTAQRSGHFDFSSQNLVLSSNEELQFDFSMTPKPVNARITGRFIDAVKKNPLTLSNPSRINLYENSANLLQSVGGNSYNFDISFNSANPRCFTLATSNTYTSGFAGNFACGFPLQAQGWSSAVVDALGVVNCSQPWVGASGTDRVCVNPGDTVATDIPLIAVPTATITGYVFDQNGTAIKDADIFVRWHDNTFWPSQPIGRSDPFGYFEVIVPAEQELFPNQNAFYIQLWAQTNIPMTQCCTQNTTIPRASAALRVGPIKTGDLISRNLIIDTTPAIQNCGNARGLIRNDQNGAPVDAVNVVLASVGQSTSSGGQYIFECLAPSVDFRLPVGLSQVTATHSSYYSFTSAGNNWYRATSPVTVLKAQSLIVPDISLWPKGFGTISGLVQTPSSAPISGMQVILNLGTGGSLAALTDVDGKFTIQNVPETWPPPQLKGNLKYQQAARDHSIQINATSIYESYATTPFTLDAGETKSFNNIVLTPKGFF